MTIINVRVHANSSKEEVRKTDRGYEVWLKQKPINGKANLKLLKVLKTYFKKTIKIIGGFNNRNKKILIENG